ncbi:hypothetical protein D6C87_09418 [Aureobasidium pullulans]|uniref:C2H2-type domain-containing protein n=1 Tax=Aureobasidium pullulans TaxID=5580 RepID=A0AB38LKF4_AURPU|nr:hypothetical protein D6C94_09381 [Aureobasidium pullulans]THZ36061.1 hypothetical protein D6C87_09418 [Aureobasidium pullulans]THZ77705.1 hypothetical protein D6C88_06727 [Aureobasidium pullulans]
MAPYNSHYGNHYDPVGSQHNQQHHQSHYTGSSQQPASQQRSTTQTPQPQSSAPPGYQPSYTSGYTNQQSYYNNYQSTESRAAETLSHLSAQEHPTTSSTRPTSTPYDTNTRAESSWNTSDRPSTHQRDTSTSWHNADRRAANPSPLYQQEHRPASTASNYSPAQSYTQPASNTGTYSYSSYSQSEQPRAQTSTTNQSTSYDYSASNFRASSPYLARQQQQQPTAPRSSISSVASTAPRDHHLTSTASHPVANVSQPRAPSVTPSSIQQRASSSYARQSHPPDQGYGSGPTTVDPTQVYDPWPEQQRKLAEARRKAEAEEKRRAEEEARIKAEEEAKRKAEEEVKRKAEEEARKKAEEEARQKAEEEAKRKAEEEAKRKVEEEARRKVEEERKAEEKRKEDAKRAESLRLAREIANQEEAKRRQYQQLQNMQGQQPQTQVRPAVTTVQDTRRMMAAAMAGIPPSTVGEEGGNLESEMAAIFRRMRDLNQADPQMFARMWETERQAHLTKAQGTTQSPAPAAAPVPVAAPARPSQGPARPVFTPASAQTPQAPQASMVSAPPTQPHVPAPHPATAGPSSHAPSIARKQTAPPSVPPAGGGGPNAIWPPGKKATLAETATKWLNARKENLNKLVSVEAIHALLAPNPSYMTLCESLERMGLNVDRAQFARALLSVVPDAAKANNHNKPTSPALPSVQPPPAVIASSSNNASQPGSAAKKQWPNIGKFPGQRGRPSRAAVAALQDRGNVVDLTGRDSVPPTNSGPPVSQPYHSGHHPNDAPTVNYQSDFHWAPPVDDAPDYNSAYTPPQQAQPSQAAAIQNLQAQHRKYSSPYFQPQGQAANVVRPTPPPAVPRPPPANKGEAARKRNFAELVDMSAMNSDSDEDMPPAKQANTGQYDMGLTTDQVNNVHSNGHFNPTAPAAPVNLQQYYFNGHMYPTYIPTGAPQTSAAAAARPMIISKHVELKHHTLVEPVRRAKVARKSRYDPRTICRDVLLATGRHPDMRPLNQHLNVMHNFLKNHSEGVELDKFDLETIRWDLIDPGEPIIEPLEPAEADRESTISEERNIATDADDEGGSEDEGGAPLTSDVPPAVTITDRASTSEDTPAPSASIRRASMNQVVAVEINTNKGNAGRTRKPFPKAKGRQPRKSLPVTASATFTNGRSPAKPSTRRHTDLHQRATSSIVPDTPRNKQNSTNMSSTPVSTQPIGYSAFRSQVTEFDENGNPIKKKGRPVGWRKSIHSKAALAAATGQSGDGVTPSASKSSAAQRTSRPQAAPSYAPPKQRRARQPKPAVAVESKEPEVEFNVFKCEWEDCGSELHNIDTLRKHVIKIHGKKTSEDDYECAWSACFKEDEITAFDDMGSWMAHMENEHIKPITHKLGDGPRAGLSDHNSEISDAYLSDSRGRLVTPIISMVPPKKDTKEWRHQQAREADAIRLSNLTGTKLNDEKLLQQMEEKYRIVGPAMMRAGSTLMTAERRRNFLHDEDFYEVVDPNEGPGYPPDSPTFGWAPGV